MLLRILERFQYTKATLMLGEASYFSIGSMDWVSLMALLMRNFNSLSHESIGGLRRRNLCQYELDVICSKKTQQVYKQTQYPIFKGIV